MAEPEPRLRGKLVPEQSLNKAEKVGPKDSGITIGATIIQRDGDHEYFITGFTENKWGKRVHLTGVDGENKITLSSDDLEEKLRLEGSPWRRKIEKPESIS